MVPVRIDFYPDTSMSFVLPNGIAKATMQNGDKYEGHYTEIDQSIMLTSGSFGAIIGSLGSIGGVGLSQTSVKMGATPAMATLYGPHGRTLVCEVMFNRDRQGGFGACKLSTGELYRVHFGRPKLDGG